jgi:hypothetical protein
MDDGEPVSRPDNRTVKMEPCRVGGGRALGVAEVNSANAIATDAPIP